MAEKLEEQPSAPSASSGEDALETSNKTTSDARTSNPAKPGEAQENPTKPSFFKRMWNRTELDVPTIMLMFKGSLAPTIAIATYQSSAVASHFSTLGYLVAIMSILGFPIMPRAKFIQTMSLNLVSVCLAAAINLLALYCVTQARLHTTPPGRPLSGYNSSASAVCAVWLIVQVYIVNVIRAARPQFQFPAIIYSIFVFVSTTYGTQFPTMAYTLSFMKRLLEAFLTGFALSTAVSFFVFPMSMRTVVFKEMTGYLMCLSGVLKAQTAYMQSLEDIDPAANIHQREILGKTKRQSKKNAEPLGPLSTPASLKLQEMLSKTVELQTKLHGDIVPAKREIGLGKLESHDLTELWKLLRMVFVPVIGLSASFDLLQRRAAEADWAHEGETDDEKDTRRRQLRNLHLLMKSLHDPFARMTGEVQAAIMHVLITLELVKPPKKNSDEESKGDVPVPGSPEFLEGYRKKVHDFYQSKQKTLDIWCKEHNIELPPDFFESTFKPENRLVARKHVREGYQRSLFMTLYLEYLLWRTGCAVLDLISFVEKRKQEGALKRTRLIFPGSRTTYKWFRSVFGREDFSEDDHFMADLDAGGSDAVFLGQDFSRRKDPEHLPPSTFLERFGEHVRSISTFFRSDASAFGLRVVCATMTIGIVCFLKASQEFFLQQRLLWALIMVAISMTRTAGQSTFNFILRILGTAVAMVGSYIIWYIVDGRTPGVIIFHWLWMTAGFYFVLKMPKLIIVAILSVVTSVLIIGYELQVKKIGVKASESNGQPAYPTYELAPYRLATVVGGLAVAYIWTVFPYPVSESSELRKDLGASLYLLSNFYSVIHETVRSRVNGTDGQENIKGSHSHNLEKARNSVFSKLMLLLNNLKTNAAFSKFQMRVGGRFPREEYDGLIACSQRLLQYTALIGYASATFSVHGTSSEPSQWSRGFRKLVTSVNTTSHQITSILSLLSSSLANGQPLPPYLEMPKPFEFVHKLSDIDPDLLSVRHIAEPEYSAFAVVQICASAVSVEVEKLTRHVVSLVGEIDFTFHAISNDGGRKESSDSDDDEKRKLD